MGIHVSEAVFSRICSYMTFAFTLTTTNAIFTGSGFIIHNSVTRSAGPSPETLERDAITWTYESRDSVSSA